MKLQDFSKTSLKNISEANEEEMYRERYISPELRHKIIDDLRLEEENYWLSNNDNSNNSNNNNNDNNNDNNNNIY